MRKRSAYRPRPVLLDALAHVKSGMKPLTQVAGEYVKLKIINHDALLALTQGKATWQSMNKLIAAGNMAEAFAHQGIGAEWNAEIRAGEDAILAVARRDKWVCKAGELNAIRELMDVHDAQLEVVTVSQVEKALAHIKEVKRNKRARRIEA